MVLVTLVVAILAKDPKGCSQSTLEIFPFFMLVCELRRLGDDHLGLRFSLFSWHIGVVSLWIRSSGGDVFVFVSFFPLPGSSGFTYLQLISNYTDRI